MKPTRLITIAVVVFALFALSLNMAAPPAAAQSGRTIVSAVFSIYVYGSSLETVNLHRVTVPWAENTVTWNSFAGGYNPAVIGSFTESSTGWYTVNVTSLVQAWVNAPAQNFGLLLDEPGTTLAFTHYYSSEYVADPTLRPKLDIDYTTPGVPGITHVTIQRGLPQGGVADTFIEQGLPNQNWGSAEFMITGRNDSSHPTFVKQALVRFELTSPTAVTLQSLNAHASPAPDLTLPAIAVLGIVGTAALRLRRTTSHPT